MNLAERTNAHLANGVVGLPTALATTIGLVMASPVILTATTGFSIGGSSFVVAMVIALVLMAMQAMTFAEAATMMPTTGSVYDYIACGLGRVAAITGTLAAYLLVHVFAGTAETILSGVMATVNFDALHRILVAHDATWAVGVGLVLIFATLNWFGISVFAKVEIVLTAGMWLTLMIFAVGALLREPQAEIQGLFGASQVGTDSHAVMSLVGMAMFMFLGIEFVTPLAPELRQAQRNLPRAMLLGLMLVWLCMLLWGTAMARQVPNVSVAADGSVHLLETPGAIPQLATAVMGPFGRLWLGIAFLLAGAATINTLMAALPRIFRGMARDGALPAVFARLHPRYRSPVVGIVVSAAIPIVHTLLIRGDLDRIMPLVLAAVCSWGVAYLLINLSIIVLRLRRPDLPRAFRAPWFPLPQLLASAGIVAAVWLITPPTMNAEDIYGPFGAMLALALAYAMVWTLLVKRLPGFTPVPVEQVLAREFERDSD
ncbi:APC family permease [uncultured Piscinibacter sp.]|uniref:APC family permease n=1 Tax=uncultured Piscinibacter sp. TaxID=1131835 RepID=UPI002601F828|nr:APC family permease [uncultured Piscinibacter sp.]